LTSREHAALPKRIRETLVEFERAHECVLGHARLSGIVGSPAEVEPEFSAVGVEFRGATQVS
jgi:hypothetical protein